jgi:hypothetical protein
MASVPGKSKCHWGNINLFCAPLDDIWSVPPMIALDGGERSASDAGFFTSVKRASRIRWIGGRVYPSTGLQFWSRGKLIVPRSVQQFSAGFNNELRYTVTPLYAFIAWTTNILSGHHMETTKFTYVHCVFVHVLVLISHLIAQCTVMDRLKKNFSFVVLRPNAGYGLLIHEVSRSHTTTHHNR